MSSFILFVSLPQNNGGSPISHYVVEKRNKKKGIWEPVSKFCRTPECEVMGLEEGEQYDFRVSAVNEQGQGEPLETSKPITAKHPFGKREFTCTVEPVWKDHWP